MAARGQGAAGNAGVISGIGSDDRGIAVVGYDDFVMSGVPVDTVGVRQAGAGPLDDAQRGFEPGGFAAINGHHAQLLDGNGELIGERIYGDAPSLMRNEQAALGLDVAVGVIVEDDNAVVEVVVDGKDFRGEQGRR